MNWLESNAELARRALAIRDTARRLTGAGALSSRLAVAMVALVLLTAATVGGLTYRNVAALVLPRVLDRLETHTQLLAGELENTVRSARADVVGFRSAVAVDGIVRATLAGGADARDGVSVGEWQNRLAVRFAAELAAKPDYQQFRIIGAADGGREILRVDRSGPGGTIRRVPAAELQRQGDSDYFRRAIALSPGDVHISEVELNREQGAVEMPPAPVVRAAALIASANGQAFGIVVINVDLGKVFARIRSAAQAGSNVYVVNARGDYLVHPDSEQEFGFEFGRPARLQDDFPALAEALGASEYAARLVPSGSGQLFGVGVASVSLAGGPQLAVVETMRHSRVMAAATAVRNSSLFAGLLAALGAVALAILLARSLARPLVEITRAVASFSRDAPVRVPADAGGEIGELARAFARMMADTREKTAALRESGEIARGIADTALDAFVQMDEGGKIVEWNPQAVAIFGWSREEAMGRELCALIVPEADRERHREGLARFLRGGASAILGRRIEMQALRRDGRQITAELTVTALRRKGGFLFNGFIRDVTERIRLEQQLRQSQKMEAIGQLTGGIAHDFNNLLAVMLGNLELLERRLADPALRAIAGEARSAAEMGARLTDRLLTVARQQRLETRRIDLNEFVEGMTELLRRAIGPSIQLTVRLARELWPTRADPGQVESALLNLTINARDAMPKGGRIVIETMNVTLDRAAVADIPGLSAGDYVVLVMSDTGRGMSPEVRVRVFEPFFTTKEKDKGSGLGLATVYGFARQSGGNVTIYSEVGKGTTVKLYLPRSVAAELELSGADPPALVDPGQGQIVLIVEDDERVRRLARSQVLELGYRVIEAKDGATALARLEAHPDIAVVFSDLVMPGGLSGLDIARHVRAHHPAAHVILTSGYSAELMDEDEVAALKVQILRKPYRQAELARALGEALSDPPPVED